MTRRIAAVVLLAAALGAAVGAGLGVVVVAVARRVKGGASRT